ncbi:hypothetical protein Tco_1238031 [Tanacetum coccineum]
MSTQQDIYVVGSENRPPMLNKDNYVPWSSRLLRYEKSKPNGNLLVKSILEGQYKYRMIEELGDPDRTPLIILMGLLEDIYVVLNSCSIDHEIWLRVQQMMKVTDIRVQEKEVKLLNELERSMSTEGESIESYYHRFAKLMNDLDRNQLTPKKITCNLRVLNNFQPEWKRYGTLVHQTKKLHDLDYNQLYNYLKQNQEEVNEVRAEQLARTHDPSVFMANTQTPYTYQVESDWVQCKAACRESDEAECKELDRNGNGNVVAAQAKGNGNGNNANQIRIDPSRGEVEQLPATIEEKQSDESLEKIKVLEKENERVLRAVVSQDIVSIVQSHSVVDTSNLQTELERTKGKLEICIIKKENKYASIWNKWYKKCEEFKYDRISYDKDYNDTQHQIEWLQAQLGDLKGKRVESTTKSRRSHPRSNTKNDRVPSASKSSCIKNNKVEVEENHRNLLQNDKFEVVCASCKKCLNTAHHDECVFNYVNGMSSHDKNQSANVSNIPNQTEHMANVKKSKKLGSKERLASPRPCKPRTCLRWFPTGGIFNHSGKIIESSDTESESETSVCANASAYTP